MPSGDRTGPEGYGPRSGRSLGYCSGYDSPGYIKGVPRGGRGCGRGFGRGPGKGFGRGYGRGFGWGRGREYYPYPDDRYYPNQYPREPYPNLSKEDEKHYLQDLVKSLENELKSIKNRLEKLGNKTDEETP